MDGIRKYTKLGVALVALLVVWNAPAVPPPGGVAPVDPPPNGFAIDGDLMANTPAADVGDWVSNTNIAPGIGGSVLTSAGVPINTNRTFHFRDPYNGNDNVFVGGLKWKDNPSTWSWTTNKASSKTDVQNVLIHLTSDTNGHTWAVLAADRYSTSGDSYIDFEFLQNLLTANANKTFSSAGTNGGRTVGDFVVSLAFISGGSVADFYLYRWQTNGLGGYDYVDSTAMMPAGRVFVALNSNNVAVPYGAFGLTNYSANAFVEAAVDLTALLGGFDPCASFGFKTIMVKTKSSASDTATIEDFVTPFQYTLRIGPNANAGPDQVLCTQGAETDFVLNGTASSGLSTVASHTWSVVSGDATIDDTNSLATTARVFSGSATLRLTAVQANGCTESDTVVLSVQQPPICAIAGITNTCPRTTNTFSAPAGMTAYAWSVSGGGFISGAANQQTVKVVASATCGTNYSLALSIVSNVCLASCSTDVAVIDTGAPVLTCPPDKILDCPSVTTTNVTGVATATDTCSRVTVTYWDDVTNLCGQTKIIARTWTATDECGNSVSCVQTITLRDITPPVIFCPTNRTLEFPANTSTNNTGAATATDACGTPMIAFNDTVTTNCGNTYVISRLWTATDACGNNSSCTQTITVRDSTAPVISCPTNRTLDCPADTSTNNTGTAIATDAGGSVTITFADTTTNGCGNTFGILRRWTATDLCNNSSTCTQVITVRDITPPVITCPPDLTLECPAVTTTNATGVATATDECGSVTISFNDSTTNLCGNTKSVTRKWTATDLCGNKSTCTQTIRVVDTTPPVITCAADKTVECTMPWTFNAPTATDTCGTNSIAIVSTVTNAVCGNAFTATRTWRATDACGNQSTCSQTVTVVDTTPPVITCASNKTVECTAAWTFNTPTATDTCGTNRIDIVDTVTNSTCGNALIATRTWRATDACGNQSQCSQTVTVVDTTPPVISCASNKTVQCTESWSFDTPTATDTCGTNSVSIISTTTNGTCGSTFVATRTWRATDACGNTAQCSQTVTVVDTTPPTINCIGNKVVECTTPWMFDAPTASDTCGTNSIAIVSTTTNATCGNTFIATRTWRATDACGNQATCSQTVTVVDTTPPVISCVADKTVECTIPWTFNAPTATDTCGTNVITILSTTTNAVCGNSFIATRTWRATDACGNQSTCSQTVTVVDTTPPVITCASNKTVECTAAWTFNTPTATDTCGTNRIDIVDTVTNSTCGNALIATRTWRATDACGNQSQCSQTVTVVDTTPPVISCASNKTVQCTVPWSFDAPIATDTCGTNAISIISTTTNGTCGSTFVATRTWRATDACGNTAQCSQTVTVVDTTPPTINCVGNKTVECTTPWTFDAPTASDTCGTNSIAIVSTTTNATCGNTFIATRTWRATDACGNQATCSQTVSVVDTTPPVISCAVSKSVQCGSVWTFDPPGANDLCGTNSIAIVSTTTNATCGNTYAATRTWRATDACGNQSTCSQTVSVIDTTAPVITCPANITIECPASPVTNLTGVATATDNCGSAAVTFSDSSAVLCGNAHTISRMWRATDLCGNSSTCVQTITVRDLTPPVLFVPTNITVECGNSIAPTATGNATATDTCNSVTVSYSDTVSNTCGNARIITRRWLAMDSCNNSNVAFQTITVRDTTPPVLTLPTNRVLDCPGNTSTNNTGVATATDACGSVTITYSDVTTNGCGMTRTVFRTWTATDQCGNSSTGVQTIQVRNVTPAIVCRALTFQCPGDVPPAYTNLAAFLAAGNSASSPCDAALDFALRSDSGLVGRCPGTIQRVYRVTDDCGAFAECTQTITVDDTIAPVLTCPPALSVECGVSLDPANIGFATATDNCATNVSLTHTDAIVQGEYNLYFYVADPDTNTGPYAPTYLEFGPASLPCPEIARQAGRALDPLRNAVAYSPNGQLDALTSIGNVPMALGQIVPFEVVITASGGPGPEHGTVEFTAAWNTYTTSNNRFGYDTNYMVYCAFVDAADPGLIDPNMNARVESYSSTVINRGSIDEAIQGTFRVSGLDAGDRVVVEIWVVLDSTMPDHTGGTVAAGLISAQKASNPPVPITVGVQTDSLGNLSKIGLLPPPQTQPPLGPLPPQPPVLPGATVNVIDRTWAATDDCGNRSTCVQRITVRDTRPPVITAPNVTLECPADTSTDAIGSAAAVDACGSVPVLYSSDVVSNGCGNTKIVWRTWTATDQSGNTTNLVQTITVRDTIAPTISCPPDVTLVCPAAATAPDITGIATATDGCGTASVSYTDSITNLCGISKIISRTWTATDACGNRSSCVQKITVSDTTPPLLTVPTNRIVDCGADTSTNAMGAATAVDGCGTATVSFHDAVLPTCANGRVITRTWTATDACGNSTNAAQTITVRVLPPVITCPTNVTLQCPASPTTNLTGVATATSSCGGSLTIGFTDSTSNICGGSQIISRSWRATDACGNSATCVQTITITDTTPPTLTVGTNVTINAGGVFSFSTPSATDTCSTATIAVLSTVTNNLTSPIYDVTRTWRATDACGNAATNQQTISVIAALPRVSLVSAQSKMLMLRWPAYCTNDYRLEVSVDLKRWSPAGMVPVLSNGWCYVQVSMTGPQQYFRLVNTPPALDTLRTAPGKLTLTWPTAPSGFTLESSDSLNPPNWAALSATPVVSNLLNHVDINLTAPKKFYRLKKTSP